jgi:3-oxoacyl-[acyl-carrier-protein] synthase II
LHQRRVPPNAHCAQPDPSCTVPLVLDMDLEMPALRAAISSSFAFGGTNSVLLFSRD